MGTDVCDTNDQEDSANEVERREIRLACKLSFKVNR